MTTLLALYRRPDGGPDAQATFERRYTTEHLPLVAGTPGLRETRVHRVVEALGAETDLILVTAMRFDDRAALDAGLRSDANADASTQRRIRQDPDAKEVDQHRRVAQPRQRELIVSPVPGVGCVRCGRDGSEISLADTPQILEIAERDHHLDVTGTLLPLRRTWRG